MKVQIASDLHLEHIAGRFPGEALIQPTAADVLVLAGDIHNGHRALATFAHWPTPIVYVLGNHEFYGGVLEYTLNEFRQATCGTHVHLLENDSITLLGTRFLGCTLWTSFDLEPERRDSAMQHAVLSMADFRTIGTVRGPLTPPMTVEMHRRSVAFLGEALAQPHDGPTVVVTHHAPHRGSIHPRFEGNALNPGFVTDLAALMGPPTLWIHGHVHDSCDYRVNGTRVVANPRGYPRNQRSAATLSDLSWENPHFDPALVAIV